MDAFLEQLRGSPESSGSFTIDWKKAKQKLAAAARLEPGLMLGHLVQAAVASQASEISFKVTSREVCIQFWCSHEPGVYAYLTRAILLAASLEPEALLWEYAGRRLDLSNGLAGHSLGEGQGQASLRFIPRSQGFWNWVRGGAVARSSYHTYLTRSCRFCPIRVTLDEKVLNQPGSPKFSFLHSLQLERRDQPASERILAMVPAAFKTATNTQLAGSSYGSGRVKILLNGPSQANVSVFSAPPSSYGNLVLASCVDLGQWVWTDAHPYLSLDHLSVSRWVSLSRSPDPGQLLPIRDGVMLDPVEMVGMPGLRAVVAIPDLNLDLECRQVIRDHKFAALIQDVRRSMREHLPVHGSRLLTTSGRWRRKPKT